MNCELMEELISCYADGMLDGESAELVEQHLSSCESCRELLDFTRELSGACRSAWQDPPADLRACVMDHIRQRSQCERFEQEIALAPDTGGTLSLELSSHLKECHWCANELEELCEIIAAAPAVEQEVPAGLRERIAVRTYARASVFAVLRRALAPSLRYAAAGLLAGAAVLALLCLKPAPDTRPAGDSVAVTPPVSTTVSHDILEPEPSAEAKTAAVTESAASARPEPARRVRTARVFKASRPQTIASKPAESVPVSKPAAPAEPAVEEVIVLVAGTGESMSESGSGDEAPASEPVEIRPVAVAIASPQEVLERHMADDPLSTRMKEILEERRKKAAAGANLDFVRTSRQSLRLIAADF
ncbi:MAG: hypothetical protein KatS3mg024_2053 [Armatimonadota bacterium]|nr:MAG: hypothetical protein KatS3mg024_2053 [Armatimonadota bacterium]